ncbi:MAG: sensor histidine kinase [Deltaproteobacteria bacterium]
MTFAEALTLLACGSVLALAALAARRGRGSPLRTPLVLLCLDTFTWNFAALADGRTGLLAWHRLDIVSSPLGAPLTLHVLLAFVGRLRERRRALRLAYGGGIALALASPLSAVSRAVAAFDASPGWPLAFLALALPTVGLGLWLLYRHRRESPDLGERERTGWLFATVAIVFALASTELLALLWTFVPRLGGAGTLVGVGCFTLITLRFRLFDRDLPSSAAAEALGLTALALLADVCAFRFLGGSAALVAVAVLVVTVALYWALRRAMVGYAGRRERLERLATLGTFADQLAHDIQNPLAALRGAVQYLHEEWAQGRAGPGQGEFLDLVVQQTDRLQRVVERYRRIGRVDPRPEPSALNEIVRGVLALEPFAAGGVALQMELAEGLPPCPADRDLVGLALENLLRNAVEAMPGGGTLTVRTAVAPPNGVLVAVEDTGAGMDARLRERVASGLVTTKVNGSGLGLAFARRVAEAHGGELTLTSAVGQGTLVALRLPSG